MSSPGHSAVSGQNLIKLLNRVRLALGIALGIIALILVIYVACVFWRHLSAFLSRWRTASLVRWHGPQKTGTKVHLVVKNLTMVPLPYTFEEIMDATENPNDAYIIGRGAHGVVYKVALSSRTPIAVKKIEPLDITPALVHKSFRREIETVGKVKHRNLATLLGFMQWGKVGLLLYDYVCNGNLHSALHNREQAREIDLNWKVRLHIAEGVARGLAYLHHDHNPPIVHRDIKSSNVLLDEDLKACISDFGLAKVLAISQVEYNQWLTTANVLGTFGYIAPEVAYGSLVTPKVDVYAYGVLLMELLTGRQPVDKSFGETWHVVAWVKDNVLQNHGRMSEAILDPSLLNAMNLVDREEMFLVQRIALLCTRKDPKLRPTMRDVADLLKSLSKKMDDKIENGDDELGESTSKRNEIGILSIQM